MEIWFYYGGIALIFVVFALSLNLLLGFAGQVSVAHAAFGAIGGYAVGYLTLTKGWNFVPALLIGIAIAFVVGYGRRLPGDAAVGRVPDPAHPGHLVGDHRRVHDVPRARRHLRPDQPPEGGAVRLDAAGPVGLGAPAARRGRVHVLAD